MIDIDLDVCKVSALKNDSVKEIKSALRVIEEDLNHVNNLLNREGKRKHQALEVEEKEVEDRCLVRQLWTKTQATVQKNGFEDSWRGKDINNRRQNAPCSQLWCAGSCFSQLNR